MLLNYDEANVSPHRNFQFITVAVMVYSSFVIDLVYGRSGWKITGIVRNWIWTISLLHEVNLFGIRLLIATKHRVACYLGSRTRVSGGVWGFQDHGDFRLGPSGLWHCVIWQKGTSVLEEIAVLWYCEDEDSFFFLNEGTECRTNLNISNILYCIQVIKIIL